MSVQQEHLKTSHWRDDETCSYCGSISPDAFFRAIDEGCELGPTDKDYKVYVDLKEPHPEELRVISATSDERVVGSDYVVADPVLLKRDGWSTDYKWMQLKPRGPKKFGKFYFQHLSVDERKRFIELLNAQKLNIGVPGHFYRLPFFVSKGALA